MTRPGSRRIFALVLAGLPAGSALAQPMRPDLPLQGLSPRAEAARDLRPEERVLRALHANPITAPYAISATWKNGRVALSGRVATKVIHDSAVSTAGLAGVTVEDRLVIDTAEAYRSAMPGPAARPGPVPMRGGFGGNFGTGGSFGGASSVPYVYPQPLFGVYDDPFHGFEPPYISYPPWWAAMTARRLDPPATAMPPEGPGPSQGQGLTSPSGSTGPPLASSVATDGHVEMTIDPMGVAVLRGVVPTVADKVAVGQKLAGTQGVSEIVNLLETRDGGRQGGNPPMGAPIAAAPPPSPENERPGNNPAPLAGPAARPPDAAMTVVPADETPLTTRLRQAISRRPSLASLAIRVEGRDGTAYLGGKVPTALEAMSAFRAVQQTRGVRSVVDSLEFAVPDADAKNPLIEKGRPEDVEPYLDAQIRRQVGDSAHVDRVRVGGDTLEIRGTIPSAGDKPRIEAILRSMPLLRGYRIDAELIPEG